MVARSASAQDAGGMTEPAITIEHLTVVRGPHLVLPDFSCVVASGRVTGLLGPSGSGKTTLLRAIVGVQQVRSGTVTVLGRPAGDASLRHRVAYMTQAASVYKDVTVTENVRFFARLAGASTHRADEVIDQVGLRDARSQLAGNVSGGQLSRVSLACALVGDPELLVLDEPTVGQDPVLRDELWADFRARADAGTTVLVSSHVMDEAGRCDELLLLRDGELLAHEPPAAVLARTGAPDLDSAFLRLVREAGAGSPDPHGPAPVPTPQPPTPPPTPSAATAGPSPVRRGGRGGPGITLATAGRILRQIRHDPRTLGIITVVPMVVITLLYFLFDRREPLVSKLALDMLVIFPIIVMFLLTAIAMVRERMSGTLERLMTTPVRKADILFGYALAFGLLATIQGLILTAFCYWVLGTHVAGPVVLVIVAAIVGSLLGVAFGLLASAVSTSEFQAVQFFPALIIPQEILSGLFGPRENMAGWLKTISDLLPITYAVQAMEELFTHSEPTDRYWQSIGIAAACVFGLLLLASATLRRRTP